MSDQPHVSVRSARPADSAWVQEQLIASWGSTTMVSHGQAYDATQLPTLVAAQGDALIGLATLRFDQGECELLTIEALQKQAGVGSALLDAVIEQANSHGCTRLWLITTNDNLDAIRFYQRRGMRLVAVHVGAVDRARQLKTSIPDVGEYGIPLHDELEFELRLGPRS
jgi:N-acetylglutamate synthase-like GNAT family acetyltransferase